MDKAYDPKQFEGKIYKNWKESGYFKPEINPKGKPFSIIMPPPNANGSLHLGHAVFVTIEDIMTRFARMNGYAALWLPGADHAGFETQVVFEKKLDKEGKNRFEIPRDQLYKMMLDFTLDHKKNMESQLEKLGASCDWDREKFTLDEDIIKIVYQTFKKLYDDGLVYRDNRIIHWCTKHQTSLSDLEVKYEEQSDPLYYIKYGPLVLATTRPETKFGDTAVAVNPKDQRYKKYIGKVIDIETVFGPAKIKVIADEMVDPEFGTGVVKITPAHDPNDFEAGKRHKLETKEVIDKYGKMNELAGPYKGMKVAEARIKVIEDMKKKGLVEKTDENYVHSVGKCYKCNTVIEPRILPQWYVAVNKKGDKTGKNLAKDAISAVKDGKVKFINKSFEKIFFHWMNGIRDWNISRQIVWGIRIPAWYKQGENPKSEIRNPNKTHNTQYSIQNTNIYIGEKAPGIGWVQDPDVFDTWFSSGQWPFATLKTTGDFDKYYPTNTMETAYDILFFWVARMIMLGLYVTGNVPFKKVYIHGLVRDKDRQKMSKSRGNVIDPLGVADIYGTDAVRMALVYGAAGGRDIVISEEKIKAMRNFVTKVWNASRFVLMQLADFDFKDQNNTLDKSLIKFISEINHNYSKHKYGIASEKLYKYFWHHFCDDVLENCKNRIYNPKNQADKTKAQATLYTYLKNLLQLLHPIMPFVTEAVWQELRKLDSSLEKSIMISAWPN